jgi:hypothetical protein
MVAVRSKEKDVTVRKAVRVTRASQRRQSKLANSENLRVVRQPSYVRITVSVWQRERTMR